MRRKADEREWETELLHSLPEAASQKVAAFAMGIREINPPLIIYARESVPEWEFGDLWDAGLVHPEDVKWHWGSRCLCTECGTLFNAGYKDKKILIRQFEDGNVMEGWTAGDDYETAWYSEGDYMQCPRCGALAKAIRRSSIREGRSFTTQIVELANIGSTTVLLYWLASYFLEKNGFRWEGLSPRAAVAISPEGRLKRFSHTGFLMDAEYYKAKWETVGNIRDPELMPFNEGGGCQRCTIGGYYISTVGDAEEMKGTTGEKTGIYAFFQDEIASRAASYLQLWKHWPHIESITNTGAVRLATSLAHECTKPGYSGSRPEYRFTTLASGLRFWETKPHRILGVTKQEYRAIVSAGWELKDLTLFEDYREMHPKTTAMEFGKWLDDEPGREEIERLKPFWNEGMPKLYSYLCRQEKDHGVGIVGRYYADYREMLDRLRRETGITEELTQAEIFPPDLVRAHERVDDAIRAIERERKRRGGTDAQFRTFAEMKEKYAALEWRKDKYCIIIPQSPEELVREGEILHHCVGGYASQHCRGEMIFFVRHARRPERSWYTLNENVNGNKVNRIQLHGYGNEYTHGRKLRIPNEVIDFVKEWEDTILAPYLNNNNRRTTA